MRCFIREFSTVKDWEGEEMKRDLELEKEGFVYFEKGVNESVLAASLYGFVNALGISFFPYE